MVEPPKNVWTPTWGRRHRTTGLLLGWGSGPDYASADWVLSPQQCAHRPQPSAPSAELTGLPPSTRPGTHTPSCEESVRMTPGQWPPFHRESLEGCTMGSLRTPGWGVIGPGAPPLLGEVRRWPRIQAPVWLKAAEEGAPLPAHRKVGPTGLSGTQSGSLQSSKILTSQPPADCLGAPAPLRSRPLDHHSPPLRREAEGEHAMAAAKPPRPPQVLWLVLPVPRLSTLSSTSTKGRIVAADTSPGQPPRRWVPIPI